MYNGIGLNTPRGSGTNGFVQRNLASIRSRPEKVNYKTDADIARLDRALQRKPNKEILEHEWKRKIELECVQLQEKLEEQGFTEEEVAEEVRVLRASLSSKPRPIDPYASDSHQMAEASEAKKRQLRAAFGIREDYVEGSAFGMEAQAENAAWEKAEREERAEQRRKGPGIDQTSQQKEEEEEGSDSSSSSSSSSSVEEEKERRKRRQKKRKGAYEISARVAPLGIAARAKIKSEGQGSFRQHTSYIYWRREPERTTSCELQAHIMPLTTLRTDAPPPKTSDVPLRVYSCPICPFAQRVRLLVAAKKIPNEEVNIHLKEKPEWFVSQINPHGLVPVIEHNGHLIRESRIAFDYIDAAFDGPSVWPADPYKRALDQLLVEDFGSKFIPNYYKYYRDTADESTPIIIRDFLTRLNDLVKSHPGGFVAEGATPGAVDYLIWPWLERLGALKLLSPQFAAVVKEEEFPEFYGWVERMKGTDAVKGSYQPPEAHLAFIKSVKAGVHDYSHADVTGKGITIYAKKE